MKNWMTSALAIVAIASVSHVAVAQDKMAKPMGKEKTYTGCIATGEMAGTFTLTNPMAEMVMGGDAIKKDTMGKDSMAKPAMARPMAIESKTIDLAKHVGHKVNGDRTRQPDGDGQTRHDGQGQHGQGYAGLVGDFSQDGRCHLRDLRLRSGGREVARRR